MTLVGLPEKTMQRAIVMNSFGRGGSNILMNMIGSSPSVLMASKEFWEFYYDRPSLAPKIYRRLGVWPGNVISKLLFSGRRFRNRACKNIAESAYSDYQLWKARGLKFGDADYILFKVSEYEMFFNILIEREFEKTIFIGLVRNGYGLCDSWKRRGMPARMAGRVYGQIAGQMIAERNSRDNYLLVRFEDIVSDPLRFLDSLYERLALVRPHEASYIYKSKGYGPGQESAASADRAMRIVDRSYWASLLAGNVNAAAIRRLTREDLRDFNRNACGVMQELYELRWK